MAVGEDARGVGIEPNSLQDERNATPQTTAAEGTDRHAPLPTGYPGTRRPANRVHAGGAAAGEAKTRSIAAPAGASESTATPRSNGIRPTDATIHTREVAGSKPAAPIRRRFCTPAVFGSSRRP